MKARTIILTIAAAALVSAPAVLFAQQGPGGPGGGTCDGTGPHGPGMPGGPGGDGFFGGAGGFGGPGLLGILDRLADRLELTADQRQQIETIVDAHRNATQSLREQAADARASFHESHGPGDFNEVEYRTFFEAQARIHLELQLDGAAAMSQAWNVLTADQQNELLDLIELFHDGRGGPRHGGGKRVGSR
jgi:Spy/CpxP family protein refolding chaperone